LARCAESQNATKLQLRLVFTRKQKLNKLTEQLSDRRLQLISHQELLRDLKKITIIPQAYENYIVEMGRRRLFQESIVKKATLVSEMFDRSIVEEELRLKVFKNGSGGYLPKAIFPGCDVDKQEPITIKIPTIKTLAIGESNLAVDLLGSDFASIVKEDDTDIFELKKENKNLKEQLSEYLNIHQQDKTIEMLKEVTTLKEKLSSATQSKNKYLAEYEIRFINYKQQLKELEGKVKTLTQEVSSRPALTESDMGEVTGMIATVQETLVKEKEAKSKAETELKKVKEELIRQENYRKNLVEHFTKQLKEEKFERELAEGKLATLEHTVKYNKDLERELTDIKLSQEVHENEVLRSQEELKTLQKKIQQSFESDKSCRVSIML